jgi:hypothetical protein
MNFLYVFFFASSVSIFCWFNDVSSVYSQEEWRAIHEYWSMHSDRSYVPDLPNYGLPENVLAFFNRDSDAFWYYDAFVSVVLEDVPSIGHLVDCYESDQLVKLETEKYIYVTSNGRIEVSFFVGSNDLEDRSCVKIFDSSGRLMSEPFYIPYASVK